MPRDPWAEVEEWRAAYPAIELPAPEESQEWPTPAPLPLARSTPEGFAYFAVNAADDPCGSGPIHLTGDDESEAT